MVCVCVYMRVWPRGIILTLGTCVLYSYGTFVVTCTQHATHTHTTSFFFRFNVYVCTVNLKMGCAISSVPDGDYVVDTVSVIEIGDTTYNLNPSTSKLNLSEGNWSKSNVYTMDNDSFTLEGTPISFQIMGPRTPIECEGSIEKDGALYYLKGQATQGYLIGTYTIGLEPPIPGINAAF